MEEIRWGMIGCGDVTEKKSGPAFNKVNQSKLVAVMRRNAALAEDYAKRHQVARWYTDAEDLINDPEVNAIYIATPPASHEEYALRAMSAGKPVYVEKPMTVNAASAIRMMQSVESSGQKLVVAHYRRAQPFFLKIKEWIHEERVGPIRFMRSSIYKRQLSKEELAVEKTAWRVEPKLAGGGLFHDLAPHQLDLAYYFFGEIEKASGISGNQAGAYNADDIVTGNILFRNGVHFDGVWCFNVSPGDEKDECEIIGEKGRIVFSFFEHKPVKIFASGSVAEYAFEPLEHVQQPMIDRVVQYFLTQAPNPCSAADGVEVMKVIDNFTSK